MRLPLFWKILLATLLPLLAFSVLGLTTNYLGHRAHSIAERSHFLARQELEAELGRRLAAVARTAGALLPVEDVVLLNPGDEPSRAYRNVRRKLVAIRKRADVRRIYLFTPRLTSLCDTAPGVAIGARYYHLEVERKLVDRVFAGGTGASVLFRGPDKVPYKTGFAPLADERGRVVAALGVEGSTASFRHLRRLSTQLVTLREGLLSTALLGVIVVISLIVLVVASLLIARSVTRPVGELMQAAGRIGRGDLSEPITPASRDELAVLARALDQMRRDLAERKNEMDMMLSGIAHEVRNPLGGIDLFAGLLRERVAEDDKSAQMVERIKREIDHLGRVVNEFLDFARRTAPTLGKVDAYSLGRDVVEVLGAAADRAQIALALRGVGPARVQADSEQLRRVLLNLLQNALQATPAGGDVTLTVTPTDDRVVIEVTDSGRGIEPADLDKIWAAFYTTKERGTGLGLAFVKRIVDAHGGEVEAASQPGAGTTFTVRLPRAGTLGSRSATAEEV